MILHSKFILHREQWIRLWNHEFRRKDIRWHDNTDGSKLDANTSKQNYYFYSLFQIHFDIWIWWNIDIKSKSVSTSNVEDKR